jgi:hypothetical protein
MRWPALGLLLLLGGCGPSPEEKAHIAATLPPGCVLRDLGYYGSIKLLVVTCDGRVTHTTNGVVRNGKTMRHQTSVVIENK